MAGNDTITLLARELGFVLQPFLGACVSSDDLLFFLNDLGWDFDPLPDEVDAIRTPALHLASLLPDDVDGDWPDGETLIAAVGGVFLAIAGMESSSTLPETFKTTFPRQFVNHLLVHYLLYRRLAIGYALKVLGLIKVEDRKVEPGRIPYEYFGFGFDNIMDLLGAPLSTTKATSAWGTDAFATQERLSDLATTLQLWSLPAEMRYLDTGTLASLLGGDPIPEGAPDWEVRVPIVRDVIFADSGDVEAFNEAGLSLFLLPQTDSHASGIAAMPYSSAGLKWSIELLDWILMLSADADADGPVALVARAGAGVTALSNLTSGSPTPFNGGLQIGFRKAESGRAMTLLGAEDGSRLECSSVGFEAGVRQDGAGGRELYGEVSVAQGKLVVTPQDDSFLAALVPANGLECSVDGGVGISSTRGLYFRGGIGGRLEWTLHKKVGGLDLVSASLAVKVSGREVPIEACVTLAASLGPVDVTVSNLGVKTTVTFPENRSGRMGPVDLTWGLRWPDGLGVQIDGSTVSGGGYVTRDASGRYAGALELVVANEFAVAAFGLIEPLPSKGYSFLVALSVEFSPAIQLGYGFMLTGIGGLIGINRTVDADVLQKTVRTGAADRLLFPKNVGTDGPQIIKDASALLPAADGHYVVGPMAKLTWLELITGKLGLFIEFPGPRIVLLGTVQAALPDPDDAIVRLNVDVAGILDFPKKYLEIDASLRDSVIGKYPISGDMAVRLNWGDKPNFALSVGGLNPAYQAPAGFPKLNRVTVDLAGKGSKPSISLCGYFAITSNSVQLGAKAEVKASGCGIDLHGWIEFDALFVFSPFSFTATLDAGVKISFHGYGPSVHLHGELSGPSPYHVRGKVSISILWWDASLSFEKTFGSGSPAVLPDKTGADILNDVVAEIAKLASWSSTLPANAYVPVRLVPDAGKLEPVGNAVLCQRMAPLDRQISMWKGVKLAKPVQLTLDPLNSATLGDDAKSKLVALRDVQDAFAPGQYFTMTNSQKLSAQPFERMKAGAVYRHDAETGDSGPGDLDYDEFRLTLGTGGISGPVDGGPPTSGEMEAWSERSDSATSAVRTSMSEKYVAPNYSSATTLDQDIYVVCDAATHKVFTDVTREPVSKTEALLALDRYCATRPADRTKYVVIQTEV